MKLTAVRPLVIECRGRYIWRMPSISTAQHEQLLSIVLDHLGRDNVEVLEGGWAVRDRRGVSMASSTSPRSWRRFPKSSGTERSENAWRCSEQSVLSSLRTTNRRVPISGPVERRRVGAWLGGVSTDLRWSR